jgi:hypothetical protein
MCKNPGGAETQHQQNHKQYHHKNDGKSPPKQNTTFKPLDFFFFGGLDFGNLGDVGAVRIFQTTAKVITLCLEVGEVDIGGGEIEVCSSNLIANF